MLNWLSEIFETEGFPARWNCGDIWQAEPVWGWLHIVSDLATFAALTAIPLIVIYFLKRRPDLPVAKLWWLFATFIFAIGTVHLLDAITFWWPAYRLVGVIKFVTAIASWASVLGLINVIPFALTFRSPSELEREVQKRTTELRIANNRLRESDEHLRLALLAGRMGTWNWDLTRQTIHLDATEVELTGLGKKSAGVIPQEQYFERVHRDDRESIEQAIRHSIEQRAAYHHTFRMYVPGKGYRWLQGRGHVLYNRSGSPERMMGVNFDITDQMADQEALRVRTLAIEFATNGILITDARSEDHPIVYVNAAFEELTGYRSDEVLGKNCRFLQGRDTDPEAVATMREAIRRSEECQVTILNYRRNGVPFWNNLHLAPVENDEGIVTHYVGVQTDITERVEHEGRLIEAQTAAESANRAKSEFLANMSHEIRTPLTAILGCAESLSRELQEQEPRETARTIRSQGHLLLGILNDVLDLSKIEAGRLEIHKEPCSILATIADVRSLMDPQATEKNLELVTRFDSKLPETLQTDPLRFRQILLNLTSNAIKFTEQGRVEIRVDCLIVPSGPQLRVAVRDTGVGIPAEQVQSIFDAFTQVGDLQRRRMGGTGLGLTISQKLVRMLGGQLSVESEVGQGSTFTITLPLDADNVDSLFTVKELTDRRFQKESSESIDVLIPARVLIAEDTKAIQYMLMRMLQPVVDSVSVVNNGAEAVEAIEGAARGTAPYDLILMDMQMPVLNGYDATARLRSIGYDLPIIALTAGAMAGDRERCLNVGCTDYLAKPVSRGQLISMLVTYCNQGRG